MDVTDYCTLEPASVTFDEERASRFAKGVAGDFNPIHDPGSKRFCVPGDLLFGVLLHRYGVFGETAVRFAGMLDAHVPLALPDGLDGGALHLADARGREVLSFFGGGGARRGGRDGLRRRAVARVRALLRAHLSRDPRRADARGRGHDQPGASAGHLQGHGAARRARRAGGRSGSSRSSPICR